MKPKRTSAIKTLAYFLAATALLSGILTYMSTISMGFPDGHLTEFEIAVKPLFIVYGILAFLFGILFFTQARFSNQQNITFRFYYGLGLFMLIVISTAILYFRFSSTLDHGGGG